MKQEATETHSGHKRPKVLIHYALGAAVLLTASSGIYPEPPHAYAANGEAGIVQATQTVESSDPLNVILPQPVLSLEEYALQAQVDSLEEQLNSANDRVDTEIEKIDAKFEKYAQVDDIITKLYGYVGKSPYVFSGIGPSGWDCSGLVAWFYHEYQGVWLEHSATDQMNGGTKVSDPVPGDVVAFYYKGSKSSFHVGIYIGGGMMIHAKNSREDTVLESVKGFAKGENSKVAFIRY